MKRNPNFLLREVAGKQVVVPVGMASMEFAGMINLNAVGAYLWQKLETEQTLDTLTDALTERYEVAREIARADAEAFVESLSKVGAIQE